MVDWSIGFASMPQSCFGHSAEKLKFLPSIDEREPKKSATALRFVAIDSGHGRWEMEEHAITAATIPATTPAKAVV